MRDLQNWNSVLLTDSGLYDWDFNPYHILITRFAKMLGKPFSEAKALFIPTAALGQIPPEPEYAERCKKHLPLAGVPLENITTYDIDGSLSERDVMNYDVMLVAGGNTSYLGRRVRETGFDRVIGAFIRNNRIYVGISAGSVIMAAQYNAKNMEFAYPFEFEGLGYVNAYLTVHNEPGTPPQIGYPLPHIALVGGQALAVSSEGYELIG